jgi:hypothetical protein
MPYGVKSSRVAYVIDVAALPESLTDAQWIEDRNSALPRPFLAIPGSKQ